MTALTKGRTLKSIPGLLFSYPVLASAIGYQGGVVVITAAGYAKAGVTGTSLVAVGIAREGFDNTGGASGAIFAEVDEGIYGMVNSGGGDAITIADIGKRCYLVDDQTVAKTSATDTRSIAGWVRKIEGGLIFVEFSNKIASAV